MTLSTSVDVDEHLDLDLRDELDLVLVAAERLGLAALAAVALDLADGEAEDAGAPQRLLHLFELERLDDCGDEMSHACLSWRNVRMWRLASSRSGEVVRCSDFVRLRQTVDSTSAESTADPPPMTVEPVGVV